MVRFQGTTDTIPHNPVTLVCRISKTHKGILDERFRTETIHTDYQSGI